MTRRTFLGATLLTGAASMLAILAAPALAQSTSADGTTVGGDPSDLQALIQAAKQEGQLTVIALPHDWLNYGDQIAHFKSTYGIDVNELTPDAGSGDELEAIKANQDNTGTQAPDVIDVGFAFGPQAKQQGLLQPYQVSVWNTIPESLKDPDGFWYGDYYGVMAFEVNSAVVKNPPQDWNDLLKPDYKGQVALAGDPRTSSQAINAVYAAALASGGSADNASPGLAFFAKLNAAGNFVPVIAKQGTIAQGETPIVIRWDYLALSDRDSLDRNPDIKVIVPPSGILGGVYVQGISAYAPHPNAAKLWMEHLYSDQGQLTWLSGYGHPIRYNDLVARNAIPADLAAKLPPADTYAKALFATTAQLDASKSVITDNWDKIVNVNVQ